MSALYHSQTRGFLTYNPANAPTDPNRPSKLFRSRRTGPGRIHIKPVAAEPEEKKITSEAICKDTSQKQGFFKVAVSREGALRLLRSVKTNPSNPRTTERSSGSRQGAAKRRSVSPVKRTDPGEPTADADSESSANMRSNERARSGSRPSISGPISAHPARSRLPSDASTLSTLSTHDGLGRSPLSRPSISAADGVIPQFHLDDVKPIVHGNGVSVGLHLAEPVLFLQGFENSENATPGHTAMLRGSLHVRVMKGAKIRAITLKFKGKSTTKWPEGIPPRKVEFEEIDTIMSHTWPFFDAKFESAEKGTNADHVKLFKGVEGATATVTRLDALRNSSPNASQTDLTSKEARKLSLSVNQSRSFEKGGTVPGGPGVVAKGYRIFLPGDYIYNFELPLDSRLPETIDVELGSVKYELEASVERAGAFRANLTGTKEVTLIRAPAEGSLEQVEPIAISRTWEDQLHYDIVISGKSFPLGSQVPIAFKLTPLAKVQCHRIKVIVTENIEYFCSNKRVHRMEPTRKVQLFEKRADGPPTSTFPGSSMRITAGGGVPYDMRARAASGEEVTLTDSTNLLGNLESDTGIGPTEMEFSVQLPSCQAMKERDRTTRLHFDTTYQNIQVHHWIKIVLRLSRPDTIDPTKRRHFEISIDSPFHILSCRATQANISLPAYSSPSDTSRSTSLFECGCPGAARRPSASFVPTLNALNTARSGHDSNDALPSLAELAVQSPGLARPPTAHIAGPQAMQRPMHLLRAPSFNPPAFEEQEPPPALITPPPLYESIASPTHGYDDYFARFTAFDEEDDEDEAHAYGRVNVPLTPGGRVNRSMDVPRELVQFQLGALPALRRGG